MKRRITASVVTLLLLGGVAAWATSGSTPSYYVTDLGVGWGYAINEDGLVAGFAPGTDGTSHAVVWDFATAQKTDLGIADSAATGINADGAVAGYAWSGGLRHAFRWQNGVRTDLGTLPGDTSSFPTGINDSGQISGWSGGGSSGARAFVWTDGTMTDLGGLGGSNTVANAINDAGEVVGSGRPTGDPVSHTLSVFHAIHWDPVSGIGDLDDGSGDVGSEAFALNESGDVVGVSLTWSSSYYYYGFYNDSFYVSYYEASAMLWRNGTPTPLNGSGVIGKSATAVNDVTDAHGVQIVGTALFDGGGPWATLWELDDLGGVTATRLDQLVDPAGSSVLTWPAAINARGQIVSNSAGWGDRVVVLTPGSPPTPPPPPPPPPAPSPPASVSAQAGSEMVTLSWSSVSTADSYAVKRATASGGTYATIATLLAASGSYTDTTVPLGRTYYYVVTASNAGGESVPSPVASAAPLPLAPTNLSATAGKGKNKHRIDLRWGESRSQNVAQYRVYRRDSTGDVLIATVAPSNSFAATGLSSRTTYSFVVTAVHAGGQESFRSNVATATTQ